MTTVRERTACDLCRHSRYESLISLPFTDSRVRAFVDDYYCGRVPAQLLRDLRYELVRCRNCGFAWQRYALGERETDLLYDHWISARQSLAKKRFADSELFKRYAREIESALRLCQKRPFEINVLDFGMGWGYWCQMAKAYGCNAFGFEVSPQRAAFARANGLQVLDSVDQIKEFKFDFINADQVLEHVFSPRETLELLAQCLSESGFLRVGVPDATGDLAEIGHRDWKASKDALHPLEHINCFTHATLLRLAQACGLLLYVAPPHRSARRLAVRPRLRAALRRLAHRRAPGRSRPGTRLCFRLATRTLRGGGQDLDGSPGDQGSRHA